MDSLKLFFKDLEHCERFTKEEENRLYREWKDDGNLESRNKLIMSVMPWAVTIAKKIKGHRLDELIAEAMYQLTKRINSSWDPSRGRLTTFVGSVLFHGIAHEMQTALHTIRLPDACHKNTDRTKAKREAVATGVTHLGVGKSVENFLCLHAAQVAKGMEFDEELLSTQCQLEAERRRFRQALKALDGRTQKIMELTAMGCTLKQIARNLNPPVTKERVRQIREAGIEQIKVNLGLMNNSDRKCHPVRYNGHDRELVSQGMKS